MKYIIIAKIRSSGWFYADYQSVGCVATILTGTPARSISHPVLTTKITKADEFNNERDAKNYITKVGCFYPPKYHSFSVIPVTEKELFSARLRGDDAASILPQR